MTIDGDSWHIVEAKREDGADAIFRIREVARRPELTRIFVIEWPYPITLLSRLPDAAAARRLAVFEEEWLLPAAGALGWTFVASKTEDGSAFVYLYGKGDPDRMIERLGPFDPALGFSDDHDPDWEEYGELSVLLERAKAIPKTGIPTALGDGGTDNRSAIPKGRELSERDRAGGGGGSWGARARASSQLPKPKTKTKVTAKAKARARKPKTKLKVKAKVKAKAKAKVKRRR